MSKKQRNTLIRILVTVTLTISLYLLPLSKLSHMILALTAYGIISYDILIKAWKGILNRRVFDENFLMTIATMGAIALAFYTQSGDFTEAIAVMLFYQIGELFQSYAIGKSRRSISALMDIRPDYANIEVDGVLKQVDPDTVAIGTIIIVQPGERIPIDGVVISGISSLNTSALTGESTPQDVAPGEQVISGCINMTGVLQVRTTKVFDDSTVAKILELVEDASFHKSKPEKFISKFARYYTPAVCYGALALALFPPVINILSGTAGNWSVWIYRALTFLVISCPCALVVSIPLSFFACLGGASREGILIKGSNYLESLARTKTVVFDKTGTLTQGVFAVTDICSYQVPSDELLELAVLAEHASSHPISKSLQQAYGKKIDRSRVKDIQELSGHGVIAKVDTMVVAVGSCKLMEHLHIPCTRPLHTGTTLFIAIDNQCAGHILIADKEKPTAGAAITALKSAGVSRTVMLTGDVSQVANHVAANLGIQEVYSNLLPADKVEKVEAILSDNTGKGTLAFIGDGINDAPVLSRADVGIAMGAMGSDAAIEAADVVLMDDDPLKISKAIRISKKCLRIVRQNIVFALGIKFLCLALGALGFANMWLAIFADVGVMVLAVINAMRTLWVHRL